jgi:hypothetical protein
MFGRAGFFSAAESALGNSKANDSAKRGRIFLIRFFLFKL